MTFITIKDHIDGFTCVTMLQPYTSRLTIRCFPFISVQYAFTKQDLLCPSQFTTAGNKFALKCVGEVFSNQSALELH